MLNPDIKRMSRGDPQASHRLGSRISLQHEDAPQRATAPAAVFEDRHSILFYRRPPANPRVVPTSLARRCLRPGNSTARKLGLAVRPLVLFAPAPGEI